MNFFKLYIGDYQRDTAHLSVTEHGAFLLMLQHYYATEKPLPTGKALHRMLRAQDKAEREAIDTIAAQFWRETEHGLINERADDEITKAHAQAETNARIAREREAKRKEERDAERNRERDKHDKSTNRATNGQPNHSHSHSQISPNGDADGAPAGAFPPAPTSRSPDDAFAMFADWQPSPALKANAFRAGIPKNLLGDEVIAEFVSYRASTQEKYTQAEWEHRLLQRLIALKNNPQRGTSHGDQNGSAVASGSAQPARKPTPLERVREENRKYLIANGLDPDGPPPEGDLVCG